MDPHGFHLLDQQAMAHRVECFRMYYPSQLPKFEKKLSGAIEGDNRVYSTEASYALFNE